MTSENYSEGYYLSFNKKKFIQNLRARCEDTENEKDIVTKYNYITKADIILNGKSTYSLDNDTETFTITTMLDDQEVLLLSCITVQEVNGRLVSNPHIDYISELLLTPEYEGEKFIDKIEYNKDNQVQKTLK